MTNTAVEPSSLILTKNSRVNVTHAPWCYFGVPSVIISSERGMYQVQNLFWHDNLCIYNKPKHHGLYHISWTTVCRNASGVLTMQTNFLTMSRWCKTERNQTFTLSKTQLSRLCTENMWYTKVISIVTVSILEIFGANSIQNSMRQTFYIKFFWYATFFAAKFDRCSQCRSDIWYCSVVKSKRSSSMNVILRKRHN